MKAATVRRGKVEEIGYYRAMIPSDFGESFIAIDTGVEIEAQPQAPVAMMDEEADLIDTPIDMASFYENLGAVD